MGDIVDAVRNWWKSDTFGGKCVTILSMAVMAIVFLGLFTVLIGWFAPAIVVVVAAWIAFSAFISMAS